MNYPSEIPPQTLIDRRYEVVKTLGQGGFGRTYLVKDTNRFGDYFVLKEFVPQTTQEYAVNKSRELFEREAKVLNQLEHPQIPNFYRWFQEDERLFLVQQFINGKTYAKILAERQEKNQAFNQPEVIQLFKDILPVLDYIHRNNLIHRDVSPDNIILCSKAEKPILIDFGVVNQNTATQVASGGVSSGRTTVGKQSYSPIEQLTAGICYPNSDLYALAVTALNLLTGRPPVELRNSYDGGWHWRSQTKVSDSFAAIIDKMLSQNPVDRYKSASEVLAEINKFAGGDPTVIINEAPDSSNGDRQEPNKNEIGIPLIAGGVSTLAILGGIFFWQSPNISGVCDALNNCSTNQEYEAQYREIANRVEPTLNVARSDNNLNTYSYGQLNSLKEQLANFVIELETTPRDRKITDEIDQTLADVKQQLKRVEKAMEPEMPNSIFENPQVNN